MYRPSDKVDRELYYSGKKKRHTLKNVLLIDSFGSIHFLSDTYEGRVHDTCIADEARYTLPIGSILYQDAGFQGFNLPGVQIMQPKKKPRNGTLTPRKRRRTGVYHPFVSTSNMSSAISSGIGLLATSSVLVVPNFGIWSWKHVAGCITSEFG
jgi:transposase, IS4 family